MGTQRSKPDYISVIEQRRELALKFEEAAIKKHGTKISWYWGEDTPIPYGQHYYFEFASLVMAGPQIIVPALDSAFIGDEADCVYLEGLLDSMELAGYFTKNAFIIWMGSTSAMRCDLSDQDVADLRENGVENSKIAFAARRRGERVRFDGNELNKVKADVVRRWIERKRATFATQPAVVQESATNSAANEKNPSLTQRQVALRHVYEGLPINKDNDIAAAYGWKPGSLYKQFLGVFSVVNRHRALDKKRMLKDIVAILPDLTPEAKARADRDIVALEDNIATGSDR
jgi:hypothetical protein